MSLAGGVCIETSGKKISWNDIPPWDKFQYFYFKSGRVIVVIVVRKLMNYGGC